MQDRITQDPLAELEYLREQVNDLREELEREREQRLDLGEAVVTLTGRAQTAERRIDALLGMIRDAAQDGRLDVVCDVVASAFALEGTTPPLELSGHTPARTPLTLVRGAL